MTLRTLLVACVLPLATLAGINPRRTVAPTPASTVCTCSDVIELLNRLSMAQAAIDFLNAEVPRIEAAQRAAGRDFMTGEKNAAGATNQDLLRENITKSMGNVQMLGVKIAAGKTHGDCSVTLEMPGTPCLNEVINAHEVDIHVHECSTEYRAAPTTLMWSRPDAKLVAYIREEIRGYQREIEKIREILAQLPPECRSGWVGRVYYFEERVLIISSSQGAQNSRVSSSETMNQRFTREAKILFRDSGRPLVNLQAGLIGTHSTVGVARTFCSGGARGSVGPEHMITTTSSRRTEISANKEGDIEATLSFDPTTGEYYLGLQIPSSIAEGTTTSSYIVKGACTVADNITREGTASAGDTFAGASAVASGKTTPTAVRIQGDTTLNLGGPPVSVPNRTSTHTARVFYVLYRVP